VSLQVCCKINFHCSCHLYFNMPNL
jgi:hypothetical protein